MDIEYIKLFFAERKRWISQEKHSKMYKIFSPVHIFWEYLWENTMGPLWILKWWIVDDLIRSKMKRKLIISTLDRTWTDKNEVLLHAAFQILVDFIEKEQPGKYMGDDLEFSIFKFLYNWWTVERPNRLDPYDDKYYNKCDCSLIVKIDDIYGEEDDRMLLKLCKYRAGMWI